MSRQKLYSHRKKIRILTSTLLALWIGYRLLLIVNREPTDVAECEDVFVKRVIDGDTLLLDDLRRVRLLGVNTPETNHPTIGEQPFGREASEFTRGHLEGKTARLCYDRERFDHYQRTLAFVFINDELFNVQLVREGLATAETRFPFRSDYKKLLSAAEESAKSEHLGIWSLETASQ